MQLDKYKGVIKRVYEKNAGAAFEDFYGKLVDSLEIAADLMGDISPVNPVSIETPAPRRDAAMKPNPTSLATNQSTPDPFKGAILISSAPPVAGADTSDDAPEDDIDYYESKPGKGDGAERLRQKLSAMMPPSIQVQLPGFENPLTLVCGVGSPGLKFVHVNYTLQGSQEMGPRYTVMTSQKDLDKEAILKDIVAQAGAMYSKEVRVLQPRAAAPQAPPTSQDLQNMLARDRQNQSPVSTEDADLAKEWGQNRGVQWR